MLNVFVHDYNAFPELSNEELQSFGFTSPHQQITEDFRATVVRVHDGDTVTLRASFRDFTFPLRLLNIDAPELSEGGDAAREWLSNRILGHEVDIKIDPNNRVEKYGRLLGAIVKDGLDVGDEEVAQGISKLFGQKKEGEVPNMNKVFNEKQWF